MIKGKEEYTEPSLGVGRAERDRRERIFKNQEESSFFESTVRPVQETSTYNRAKIFREDRVQKAKSGSSGPVDPVYDFQFVVNYRC
jgi:hypothetical protein